MTNQICRGRGNFVKSMTDLPVSSQNCGALALLDWYLPGLWCNDTWMCQCDWKNRVWLSWIDYGKSYTIHWVSQDITNVTCFPTCLAMFRAATRVGSETQARVQPVYNFILLASLNRVLLSVARQTKMNLSIDIVTVTKHCDTTR